MSKTKKKTLKINLNKTCRTCLSEQNNLRDLFSTKIPQMLESFTNVKISEEDELPRSICLSCSRQITKLYMFKRKIEHSDRLLRNHRVQAKKQKNILNIALDDAEINKDQPRETKIELDHAELLINVAKNERIEDSLAILHNVDIETPPPLIPLTYRENHAGHDPLFVQRLPPVEPPPLVPIAKAKEVQEQHVTSNNVPKESRMSQAMKCNICEKQFIDRKRLIGHLRGHTVIKQFRCNLCDKYYPNPSTLRVHMRSHTGLRPCKCPICDKGFTRMAAVSLHMKTHNTLKPYKCDKCEKSFKIASNLERHKVLHSEHLPYCCNYCGKMFSQGTNLRLHIRTHHTHERPFLCNVCGKGFVCSTRLKRHMWVHSGYKPYKCRLCSKSYSNVTDLKNHERSHEGTSDNDKPYACTTCSMRFYHPSRLARHKKTHERPTHSCHVCLRNFSNNTLLRRHLKSKRGHFLEDEEIPQAQIEEVYI